MNVLCYIRRNGKRQGELPFFGLLFCYMGKFALDDKPSGGCAC